MFKIKYGVDLEDLRKIGFEVNDLGNVEPFEIYEKNVKIQVLPNGMVFIDDNFEKIIELCEEE